MAEILLSAFLSVVFEKLGSRALEIVARSKGIHSELKKWETSLFQIQALLNDASQKEITDESVKVWLNHLQHLAYDVDDMLDDLATEAMRRELTEESRATTSKVRKLIPACCSSFSLSTRMHHKLDDITTQLQELADRKISLGLIVKEGRPKNMNRSKETSLVDASSIVGRQGEKELLLHQLLGDEPCSQNFSIVPIIGMGGVGKTTLARLLYNETQVNDHFEFKAWVCVSDDFDALKISKIIFQSIDGGSKEFPDLNQVQVALSEKLLKKRFLLVLDDVWSESYADWEILARPFLVGAPGSKVILTTRKSSLLTQLGYDHPFHLSVLSDEDALSLFCQHALGASSFDSHPMLRPYGQGIVKKCEGLPLALIALGTSLRSKIDKEEWKEVLNSEIWSSPNKDKIVPALSLSYHDLPARLKRLFAYCSLFPKDYVFDKEELILLWMAEGFLHESAGNKLAERLGCECFEELLSRSFFQQAPDEESFYVMHDLLNDLSTSVAGDFFFRLENEMLRNFRVEALKNCRHMSFVREEFEAYGKFKAFERARSLRTFLSVSIGNIEIEKVFYLSNKILTHLISEFPMLRVLSLSGYEISEVPKSVGTLKHLRYLNLCQTRITQLPESIGELSNLQTLLLHGCKRLTELPENISKLKSLRHLDISDTPLLEKLPSRIGELKCLQTLSKVIIEGANKFSLAELKNFSDLHGKLFIKGLEKVESTMDAKNANILDKDLQELTMQWSDVFDGTRNEKTEKEVLNALKPQNDKLRTLGIMSYGGLDFPSWVGDPLFLWLSHVTIKGCKKCKSLPPLGQLPVLKELLIEDMDEIQVIGVELHGSGKSCGGVTFPSLKVLHFKNMQGLKEWSTKNEDTGKAFPCLNMLFIECCPNLVEVSLEPLPTLQASNISGCGDGVLRSVVQASSMLIILEMKDILGLIQLDGGVIKYLREVEYLTISGCNEVRYLWESEARASNYLVNLQILEVSDCKKLVSLGEKEEDNCESSLTSLTRVKISKCDSLEHYNCSKHIQHLLVEECGGITSISFPEGEKELKTLVIKSCEKLQEEELGGGGGGTTSMLTNTSTQMVEYVDIFNWPNLKSVVGLSSFIHLKALTIGYCKNLESFPDQELSNLNSLVHLGIYHSPIMDASFPRGCWPPNLSSLEIGWLKKPISEWGAQNFPASLVALTLYGEPSDDELSNSQLSLLLPSSLTSLRMRIFLRQKSLSMGLQHLTSLQHLELSFFAMMRQLPETLLPSLLELCIENCPRLEEKCSRKGSYWPLISHIPCIRIQNDL